MVVKLNKILDCPWVSMKKINYFLFSVLFFSVFLTILFDFFLYCFFPEMPGDQLSASIVYIPQIGLLTTSIIICSNLSKDNRKIFFWLSCAAIALILNGMNFYYFIYIKKYPVDTIPFVLFLSYWIPYMIWLTSAMIFLSKMIVKNILNMKKFRKIFVVLFIINFVVMFLFFSSLKNEFFVFSGVILAQAFACTYKLVLFDLTMICLICVEDIGMLILLSGISTLLSADFLFNYSSVTKLARAGNILVYGELYWYLATFLMFSGALLIMKKKSYDPRNYFRKTNSIKSNLVFWTFSISTISFMLFFIAAYSFSLIDKVIFAGLPFFIMTYSVILVIFSVVMGRHFESPFKTLASNIEDFMINKNKSEVAFSIDEFAYLQKFLLDMFEVNEQKNRAEKELGTLAAQVAHDMRSPLLAVDQFFHIIEKKLDESERVFGKRAMRRLDDIAWSLLSKYKHKEDTKNTNGYVFLYSSLLELAAEKRMEYSKHNVEFEVKVNSDDAFSLIFINPVPLKRMFSNIINNAVNAILPGSGLIEVSIEGNIAGLLITIRDNGKGMSANVLNEIVSHARSEKTKTNLGLPHAIHFLDEIGGHFDMTSIEGEGTVVSISLPFSETPTWCLNEYHVHDDDLLIIIDDSQSVHDVWDEMLKKIPDVKYQHFCTPDEALDFFRETTHQNLVVFCDYEFFEADKNGFDVLDQAPAGSLRVTVTSHLYDPIIMQGAIEKGFKLLPKDLVPHFKLKKLVSDDSEGKTSLIFIDDDRRNTESWEFFAKLKKLNIMTYNDFNLFFRDAPDLNKTIPVYIDLHLNAEKDGIAYAKEIYDIGFEKIYIATGIIDSSLKGVDYPWITDIIEKRFPFI